MAAPRLKPAICPDRVLLSDALTEAVREVVELHNREINSLLKGGMGLDRFDIALNRARQKRDDAKWALVQHTLEHKC